MSPPTDLRFGTRHLRANVAVSSPQRLERSERTTIHVPSISLLCSFKFYRCPADRTAVGRSDLVSWSVSGQNGGDGARPKGGVWCYVKCRRECSGPRDVEAYGRAAERRSLRSTACAFPRPLRPSLAPRFSRFHPAGGGGASFSLAARAQCGVRGYGGRAPPASSSVSLVTLRDGYDDDGRRSSGHGARSTISRRVVCLGVGRSRGVVTSRPLFAIGQ